MREPSPLPPSPPRRSPVVLDFYPGGKVDADLVAAAREVDALTPAYPPIAPEETTNEKLAAIYVMRALPPLAPPGLRANGRPYTMDHRPPPPAPMPTRAPGRGTFGLK